MRVIARNALDLNRALASVESFVDKHDYPVEIVANVASSKTMAQLGGLFGVWIGEICQFEAKGIKEVHKDLKKAFLSRIYLMNPIGPQQHMWVELLLIYQERGDEAKFAEQMDRISLEWVKIPQMRTYMDDIFNHYASIGLVLQELEKSK